MNVITHILSKNIVNKTVRVDGASHGLSVLHSALSQLQQRLEVTNKAKVNDEATLMQIAVGDVIALAYKDFQAFSDNWECAVGYFDHPDCSNIFTFFLKEKNECPRSHQFVFKGLVGA